ncbi:alpha/beta hydrolase [Acidipila sp. EB88]|nr:alpha/beta hydrolase [Acidipila sp. EB88]
MCHPHPLLGGTLHNKVVYHAMKVFTDLGLPVLRFNFRGAGRSEGVHDHGQGEQDDARAAINWLAARYQRPVLAAGFSFGAHMVLRAGWDDPRVPALVSLGTPIAAAGRMYNYDFLQRCRKPFLSMSGAEDPISPRAEVEAALGPIPVAKRFEWIEGGDHFFLGHLPAMQSALRLWVEQTILSPEAQSMLAEAAAAGNTLVGS